jgi:hypothetical protein
MAKPPPSTPHSDIDGIHQDEERNVETAAKTGETPASLDHARKQTKARPDHVDDRRNKEDRTS